MKTRSALRRRKTPAAAAATPAELPDTDPSTFVAEIARIAIAQICQSVGYKSAEAPALRTLTRVASLYLQTLATTAAAYTNSCNRTESNVFDVVKAMHDLNSAQGFNGAAAIHHDGCLLKSGVLKDVKRFVNTVDEIPFAKPIPRAINRCEESGPGLAVVEARGKHIPDWLPAFPDKSTYMEETKGRERDRELELWGKLSVHGDGGGCGGGEEGDGGGRRVNEKRSGGELGKEREKVMFQIGNGKKRRTEF